MHSEVELLARRSYRRATRSALALILFAFGGLVAVAALFEISGAVVSSGKVIVEGRPKPIQHEGGGIIAALVVAEGAVVKANDVLFRLDGTAVQARLGIIDAQLEQFMAQEARLLAEQASASEVQFPKNLSESSEERIRLLLDGQTELFRTRRSALNAQKAQLAEQVTQHGDKRKALEDQIASIDENISLLDNRIFAADRLKKLGHMTETGMTTLQRERSTLMASRAAISAEKVGVDEALSVTRLRQVQVDQEFSEKVLTELDQVRSEIAKLGQERVESYDRLKKLEVRSPIDGLVHDLRVHTVGAVVASGETLVTIVPTSETMIVEAQISPNDIDKLYSGQVARLRLTGLNRNLTPELQGSVIDVSPDLLTEHATGRSYYAVRLRIEDHSIKAVGVERFHPGMPVEVHVQTGMRTIASYLAKPLLDQLQRAMRES